MQQSPPAVSVVIPTFEQAAFIGRVLYSLQTRSLTDWEAIIIDDGSRDATKDVVSTCLADERIRCHRPAKTRGWAVP